MRKQGVEKTQTPVHTAHNNQTELKMKFFLLLVMLTACAASPQDLSGKMFTFPEDSMTAHVKLTPSKQDFSALTVCHRSFTDLKRNHILFSMATPSNYNAFQILWAATLKELRPYIKDVKSEYGWLDYKINVWHSICTTWNSTSGLVQLWFDGQHCIKKYVSSGSTIRPPTIIILGQDQASYAGGFDIGHNFLGMMSDVHMWDYTLSPCEIQMYMDQLNFTSGNVLNWGALEFQITDRVLVEDKLLPCHDL